MKEKRILNSLNLVNEQFISEAAPSQDKKKQSVWAKWVTVAASFVLVSAIGIGPLLRGLGNQSYTASLSNGNEITFIKSENGISNLDIAIVGLRALSETEANAVFGDVAVDASVGFEEDTNEFIYLEGTVDGFDITVTRSDVSPDTVINGDESTSDVEGISVLAGYFLTKANSQGNKTAIVYASFAFGNYTVYLETSGTEDEKENLCNTLANGIQKLIETASLNFEQIK